MKSVEFDRFMIECLLEWNTEEKQQRAITEEVRNQAYQTCLFRMGKRRIAALQTIQKWFGIHGKSVPNREMSIRLGFALSFSTEEVRYLLQNVLGEPDFQGNDYREIIFRYGLENRISYEDCLDMVEQFQEILPLDIEMRQHNETKDLWEGYKQHCHLEKRAFLQWMYERRYDFKGYSMTVLGYFQLYKKEILEYSRQDAMSKLKELLAETDFFSWLEKRGAGKEIKKSDIKKYLRGKKETQVSKELRERICEMRELAFVSLESNAELLLQLYTSRSGQGIFHYMQDKHLSDLLNISSNKEKHIRLSILQSQLKRYEGEFCPEWAKDTLEEYGFSCRAKTKIAEIIPWLEEKRKCQIRRCPMIERRDLLPLIFCVAQKRYEKEQKEDECYSQEAARKLFVELVNKTMASCQMEKLSPDRYEIDRILYRCYQPAEMYTMAEIPEVCLEYECKA